MPEAPATSRLQFLQRRPYLAFVVGALIMSPGLVAFERWHASRHPELSAFWHLHGSIKNGDSIDKVQSVLVGSVLADGHDSMPADYRPGDRLLVYEFQKISRTVVLLFRDGTLVGHDPKMYARYGGITPAQITERD